MALAFLDPCHRRPWKRPRDGAFRDTQRPAMKPSTVHPPALNPGAEAPGLLVRAMDALREVLDPELGDNLVDLGMVAGVLQDGDRIRITLIPTSATCPMADLLLDDASEAVQQVLPHNLVAEAEMDWNTPWTPERMAPHLRDRFGW